MPMGIRRWRSFSATDFLSYENENEVGDVGGLLAVTLKNNGTHFACYDGNGNVAGEVLLLELKPCVTNTARLPNLSAPVAR